MEAFFTALSKRQTMLLLSTVTFGGSESVAALDHLPQNEAELLKHRAKEMLQIPREKRIPLLVQEIKRLVTARRSTLWATDPKALAGLLQGERVGLIEVVLRALPKGLAEAVRQSLPAADSRPRREVRPEVLNLLRWKIEEALVRAAAKRPMFKFSDLLLLQSRELFTIADRLGARSLAPVLAGLPNADRGAFVKKLPPDQRRLAERVLAAIGQRKLSEADARQILAVHGGDKSPTHAIRSAGTQRLVRACLAQGTEFAHRVLERNRGELGQLFARWIKDERARVGLKPGDGGRADIVQELERLADRGIIDPPIRLPPPPKALERPPQPPRVALAPAPARVEAPKLDRSRDARPPPLPPAPSSSSGPPPPPPEARQLRGPVPGPKRPLSASRDRQLLVPPAPAPRRDAIAEREARKAGARSARMSPGTASSDPLPPEEARGKPASAGTGPSRMPDAPQRRSVSGGHPAHPRRISSPGIRPLGPRPVLKKPPPRGGGRGGSR